MDPTIQDTYIVCKKDQGRRGGGVLIAIRSNMKSHTVPELATDCEMTWVAVKLASRKTLYLSSYYRSNVAGEDSLDKGKTAWTSSVNPWMEQPQIWSLENTSSLEET